MERIFIANRGEIALRIIRACKEAGLQTVLGISEVDQGSLPAQFATRTVIIGPALSAESYLNFDAVVTAALGTGCDALHPGYGFLAENADFAELCSQQDLIFIGPRAKTIRDLGDKISARRLAQAAGVPVVPGRDRLESHADALAAAEDIGFPILLKAAAGGGGRGMQVVRDRKALASAFDTARAEAWAAFGNGTLYAERFVERARHIEVQVLGDGQGKVLHLGERDCTLQRRYQKIIEEGPATQLPAGVVAQMHQAAVNLAVSVSYLGAGTVEFIFDQDTGEFYFLEVNTRIQVEHPVTEMLTGVDLVRQQLRIAAGEPLELNQDDIVLTGHAIECRINAETVSSGFWPAPGKIITWDPPEGTGIRVDSHCHPGYVVPPFYDSMLAKLIVHGSDRSDALRRLSDALAAFRQTGVDTTLGFLRALIERPEVLSNEVNTRWVETVLQDPDFLGRLERERQ